jgi:flagellar M-ring protein FliF
MQDFFTNLKDMWDRFSKTQRIIVGVGFMVSVLAVAIFTAMYSGETYVYLYDHIKDTNEVLAVQRTLKEFNIPVKIGPTGHSIKVPKGKKEEAQLKLSEAGKLPDAVFSYNEIMDANSSFGLTQKELDLRINRSKEGSLAKTIMLMRNIKHAKVHIERAGESLFSQDQKETRVSVVLTPDNPLDEFTADEVRTILNIVKHSVLGVKAENIFISDDKSRDLVRKLTEKDAKLTQQQMIARKEQDLISKAKKILSEVYGSKNVEVKLNCELDFDKVDEESSDIAPPVAGEEQGVKISEETKESKTRTREPRDVPGTQTNIPGYQAEVDIKNETETKEARINYAYKQRKRNIVKAVGTLKRITVAVVINKEILPDGKFTDEIKRDVTDLVSNAVGLDLETRNDRISVAAMPFNQTIIDKIEEKRVKKREFDSKLFSTSVTCLFLGMILLMVQNSRRAARRKRAELIQQTQKELEEQTKDEEEVLTSEQRDKIERERFILEMVKESPDEMVKIIRTMMFDENYY